MRTATSLGDISNVLSALPTVAGSTRLAVLYSPVTVFKAQLSMASRQLRGLEAENVTLRGSVKLLSEKNTYLLAEIEALGDQAHVLTSKNSRLEKEKETLINELRAERVQGIARTRRAHELESAIKQRDAFVRAMIDINLHQHVLKDAYFSVETGCSVDEAIVSAILSAASNPVSPWSRILTSPDVTKSDLYKCAIELAAAARLRTDKSVQVARFWRHVAKCDPQNVDILTPSPSRLDGMDEDLKKEERGNMLDGLLDRLRAGEDIRIKKEEERKPMLLKPDIPENNFKSPASIFFEIYRAKTHAPICSDLSLATLSSWNSNFMASLASSEPRDSFSIYNIAKPPSNALSSSLERIRGVFSTSSIASSLNHSPAPSVSASENSLPSVNHSFQPYSSFVAGRGRSATVPFSARDLALLPVKNVVSRLPTVTAPGDKEQEAQALAGQRVRFNKQIPLMRSKAIKASRPRTIGTSRSVLPSVKIKAGLLTPPAEADSIRYDCPPTVTRKKVTNLPYFDAPTTAFPSNKLSLDPPSLQQKIRPYVATDPGPCQQNLASFPCQPLSVIISSSNSPTPQRRTIRNPVKQSDPAGTPEPNQKLPLPPKRHSSIPITSARLSSSSSNKENIPPRTRSSDPTTPNRSTLGISRIPARIPPAVGTQSGSRGANPSTPTRPLVVTRMMPILNPVQPLRIVKKIKVKKPLVPAAGSASPVSTFYSLHRRVSPPLRDSSILPR